MRNLGGFFSIGEILEKMITDLKLHEYLKIDEFLWVQRVWGGFMYLYVTSTGSVTQAVFVEYASKRRD